MSILATILLVSGAASFQAAADEGHEHGSVSANGRFTPNIDGAVFPPQPREVSNVRNYAPSVEPTVSTQGRLVGSDNATQEMGVARTAAARAAQGDANVRALLGNRYSLLQSARVRDKTGRNKDKFRVEYFSRSENRTVVTESVNGVITQIDSYAASERQPPLGKEEMTLAIDIARKYWVERGDSRAADLVGYAIQTFQPDGSPYANRVAYVSFHVESPEPPQLITWVDLTEEKVFRAGIER